MTREPGVKQLIFPICRKAESENCAIDAHHTEVIDIENIKPEKPF